MQYLPLGCVWHRALAEDAKAASVCLLNNKWASVAHTFCLFVLQFRVCKWVNFYQVLSLPPWTEFWWGTFNICEISWGCYTCIPAADGCIPPCSSAQRAVVQAWAVAVITAASLCWGIFVAEGNGLVSPGVLWGVPRCSALSWPKLCLLSKACRCSTVSDCTAGSMQCFQGWALVPSLGSPQAAACHPAALVDTGRNPCVCQWDWRGSSLLRW